MGVLKSIVSACGSGLARALEIVFYAATTIWLIGAMYALTTLLMRADLTEMQLIGVLLGAVVTAGIGVSLFSTLAELCGQRVRDLGAAAIYDALRQGREPPPYTLYLRPFASTGVFETTGMGAATAGAGGAVSALVGAKIELESQMERAVRPLGQLVALGRPLEHIGAGRLQVEDGQWKEAVRLLMSKARLLIVLPSSRIGTLDEIEMILESGLIERTVVIDPPNISHSKTFDHSAEWKHVQDAFAKRGFEVPTETRLGRLIFYGDARAPKFKERLDIDADDRIERLFRRVIRFTKTRGAAAV